MLNIVDFVDFIIVERNVTVSTFINHKYYFLYTYCKFE